MTDSERKEAKDFINKLQKTQILELNLGVKTWKQKILEDYILA